MSDFGEFSIDNPFDDLFGGLTPSTISAMPTDSESQDPFQTLVQIHHNEANKILSLGYAGNSQTQWQLPYLSRQQFSAASGRIDAGINTGDEQIRDKRGNVTGYKSKSSPTLTGGTSLTPEEDWKAQFEPQMNIGQPHSWDAGQPTEGLGTAKPSGFVGPDPSLNTVTGTAGTLRSLSTAQGSGTSYTPNKKPVFQYGFGVGNGLPPWL